MGAQLALFLFMPVLCVLFFYFFAFCEGLYVCTYTVDHGWYGNMAVLWRSPTPNHLYDSSPYDLYDSVTLKSVVRDWNGKCLCHRRGLRICTIRMLHNKP